MIWLRNLYFVIADMTDKFITVFIITFNKNLFIGIFFFQYNLLLL